MPELMDYLAPGRPSSYITDMDPEFAKQLHQFVMARPGLTINSGTRSNEKQAELYQAALKKYGSEKEARRWVAPPGKSRHNPGVGAAGGVAADLGYADDAARQWAHANAGNFGLTFPLSNEDWHIEPIGARRRGGVQAPMQPGAGAANAASPQAANFAPGPQFMPQDQNPIASQGYRNFADGYGGRDFLEDVVLGQNPLRRAFMNKLSGLFSG